MLTQKQLKEMVKYDPETGVFVRLSTGKKTGGRQSQGYIRIKLIGKAFLAHRLAWLYVTGAWPDEMIDHKNGKVDDNRWINLRAANGSENAQNKRAKLSNNKSGFMGVVWSPHAKKWKAKIKLLDKETCIGYFSDINEAAEAYLKKKREIHPFFTL